MAEKKKKSKFKKILKTLGKVAALGGAAYGASKLFGGSKGNVLKTAASEDANLPDRSYSTAKRLMTQPLAYNTRETKPSYPDPITTGGVGVKHSPRKKWLGIFKKGGRVTGVAKRGFGRALMKGKK